MAKTRKTNAQKEAERKARQEAILQKRTEQLEELREAVAVLRTELDRRVEAKKTDKLLESVSRGMYEEIEKLTKKAPAEEVTPLVLEQVNDLIGEAKKLMEEDRYVQKLNIFVPAGDLPELRDVLFVLRLVRQGLSRFSVEVDSVSIHLREAKIVEAALNLYLEGYRNKDLYEVLENYHASLLLDAWRKADPYGNICFNFDYLDSIDIKSYFSIK